MNYTAKIYKYSWFCLVIVIVILFMILVTYHSKTEFSASQINSYLVNLGEEIETEIKCNINYPDIAVSNIVQDNTLTLAVDFIYDREMDAYKHNKFVAIVNNGRDNGIDKASRQCLKEARYKLNNKSIQLNIDFKLNGCDLYSVEY